MKEIAKNIIADSLKSGNDVVFLMRFQVENNVMK